MNNLNTQELFESIQTQLTEWRRLPVKHAMQVASRDQVLVAIAEMKRRLTAYEQTIVDYELQTARIDVIIHGKFTKATLDSLIDIISMYNHTYRESNKEAASKEESRRKRVKHMTSLFGKRWKLPNGEGTNT